MVLIQGFESWGLLVLRVFLGVIFIYHAFPKLMMPGTMAKGMNWSVGSVFILGLVELLASLSIVLGAYTEVGALAVAVVMLGALYHKIFTWKVPFFATDKMGWEFDLILLGAAIALFFLGAGSISLDTFFSLGF